MTIVTCGRSAWTRRASTTCARIRNFNYVATNYVMYEKRSIYFRNLELPALTESYKFGTNIVVHLLTRWEDKLRNVPLGL